VEYEFTKLKGATMKKWMIGVLIGIGAVALGVGGAFAFNAISPAEQATTNTGIYQYGFQGRRSGMGGPGMNGQYTPGGRQDQSGQPGQQGMGRGMWNYNGSATTGTRITLDDAYTKAADYITTLGSNLQIAEIMEFENNFYVVVTESESGRGAVELLVDAYTGSVGREMGPGMMWNLKYDGHMMALNQTATDSTLTLEEARSKAQEALDSRGLGASVEGGISFYGYYTFDYAINGQTSGMLSVNGLTGETRFHNWHGTFISEKEYSE
jgi:hypothetical protein